MRRYGCLFLLTLLVSLLLNGQSAKMVPDYVSSYRIAEKWFHSDNANETTDSIAFNYYKRIAWQLKNSHTFNEILVDCNLKCGILKMTGNSNEEALAYFREAGLSWQKGKNLPDSLLFKPYLYQGSIQYNMNELDSAVFFYKKADEINSHYQSLSESERLYNKLGALYYETGELKKSIPYFEKALAIVTSKNLPNAYFFIVNYKNNIATALLKLGAYQQSLDIYKALLSYNINKDQLYSNIGTIYYEQGKLQESLQYFRRVKENTAEKYNHLSMVFLKEGETDSAAYYNTRAKLFYGKEKKNNGIDYILMLKYGGDICSMQKNYAGAISFYQAALVQLVPGFKSNQVSANPRQFTGLQHFSVLFDILTAKSNALSQEDGLQHKQDALDALGSALALAHYVERTYSSDEAKLFLKNKINAACSGAVSLALQLYTEKKDERYIAAAFGYIENNKASVLQTALQQLELSGIAGLPARLVAEEKKYKAAITRLTIGISQENDSLIKVALQNKIREAELALSSVQQKLEDNPAYHRLKFDTREIGWQKIKQQLQNKKDQAILSYYYTTNQLICFYITASQSGFTTIALPGDFFLNIASLRKQLETPAGASRKQLNGLEAQFFRLLVQPVVDKIKNSKHLVVIPYNEISYLPFELLRDNAADQIMLTHFAISYHYSANFLFDENNVSNKDYSVLAMAPFSESDGASSILPTLPFSAAEIANLPGKLITGAGATKAVFITQSGHYPIIHLATHAVANDTDPLGCYIEFYGEQKDSDTTHRLYEKEIYNLDMQQARLVILSACETGNGLLVNGEGIVSLSRSFSYAGCRSVVTSLWKADDAATAFIMMQLHIYLRKGYAKDEALQQAKLDYLANPQIDDRYKTPAYWAHMVLIGDRQPVVKAAIKWRLIAFITSLPIIVFFIYWFKRKRAL